MRYILLSADTQPVIYEAPETVALELRHFADQFLEEINRLDSSYWRHVTDPSGEKYDCLAYTVDDFVAWLNKQPETRYLPVREAASLPMEEREIIMDTARKEQNLPCTHQKYPWFNF